MHFVLSFWNHASAYCCFGVELLGGYWSFGRCLLLILRINILLLLLWCGGLSMIAHSMIDRMFSLSHSQVIRIHSTVLIQKIVGRSVDMTSPWAINVQTRPVGNWCFFLHQSLEKLSVPFEIHTSQHHLENLRKSSPVEWYLESRKAQSGVASRMRSGSDDFSSDNLYEVFDYYRLLISGHYWPVCWPFLNFPRFFTLMWEWSIVYAHLLAFNLSCWHFFCASKHSGSKKILFFAN